MPVSENLTYGRSVLYACEAFEIVACEWTRNSVSHLHAHGWSQCAVLIQEGCFENRAEFGLKSELSIYEPGQVIRTALGVAHEIRCLSEHGKTVHVYMPRIHTHHAELRFSALPLAELRQRFDLGLGELPSQWSAVEKQLKEIQTNSVSTQSPLFMNQLFSGVWPEVLVAEGIQSQARTTLATFEASPIFTAVEIEVIEQLGQLLGWPATACDGIGVPGGSAANFMAVHCARQRRVPEYRRRGSRGERFKIFVSRAAHYSLKKACLATGLGTDALVEISTDTEGRMQVAQLQREMERALSQGDLPLMVCATAGTTVLGAFDPIDAIADVCTLHGVWLHVDGAWGAPALFSETARPLIGGVERADSFTFDAHKLFGANLTSSFFLTRHRGILREANDVAGGDYIFHHGDPAAEMTMDRGRLSWQCGRGADALGFWTVWKSHGTHGLGRFVDRLFTVRDQTIAWIASQPRLRLVTMPTYLNICVRVMEPIGEPTDPHWSRLVREHLKNENRAFVNFATDEQGSFLRLILAHPRIDFATVSQILQSALDIR